MTFHELLATSLRTTCPAQPSSEYSANFSSQKRRKTAAFQQKKATQTVQRSKILQSPLITGISLAREQGASRFQNLEARVSALAKQSQVSDLLSLKICASCGKRDTVFDFAIDQATDAILWGLGSRHFGRVQYLSEYVRHSSRMSSCAHGAFSSQDTYDLAAFRSAISSVSVTSRRTVIATSITSSHPGNVFIAGLSEPSTEMGHYPISDAPAPSYMRLGDDETDLWTSSPSPPGGRDIVAIGGSTQTYMLGAEGTLLQTYNVGSDVRALDWLSPTLAVGGTRRRAVLLFDARAGGSSTRFHHSSGVTGIRSLGNGSQMVVSGFDGMAVYDVRMPRPHRLHHSSSSPAILNIPFKTERPSVAMDVYKDANLVAVGDDTNVIRLHSLHTGKLVGELGKPDYASTMEKEYITRLRFVDSVDGKPTLMACRGADLQEWTWGGVEDDEE